MGGRASAKPKKLALWQGVLTSLIAIGVFFGLVEGMLALIGVEPTVRHEDPFVGFAPNVPLFVEETDPDGQAFMATHNNKLVFFNDQRFPRVKAPGTYRIFCVGGSTTYGRPYDDTTSFAGWLRELLPAADTTQGWEVVNAGGISYASYRVAHLMEELAGYEPDLFVIYSGHNEFLEERTYGKLRDMPAALKSTSAVLARTRAWAAMNSVLHRGRTSRDKPEDGRVQLASEVNTVLARSVGPERYERDDTLRDQVLLHYRISLTRMVDIARSAGADVLFVTPASNLKDSSPFKSQHGDGLNEADTSRSRTLLATAMESIDNAAWSEALEALDEALTIDPRFAELHYRRGKVLIALARYEEADVSFRHARDEDVCPLRALSPIRGVLAEVARENGVRLVDFIDLVEQRIFDEQGHRIPGEEFFLDHLHPTIEGNRMLSVALIETMIEEGVVQPAATWGDAVIDEVTARVEGGLDRAMHAQALANLARVLIWAGKVEDAGRLASQALATGLENPDLVVGAVGTVATIAERQGDIALARQHYRRALESDPGNSAIHLKLGLTFLKSPEQNLERVAAHVLLATTFWPENDMAHQVLGLAMAERRRYAVAYSSISEALRLNPRNTEAESARARLHQLVEPGARSTDPPKVSLASYPSGAPQRIDQVSPNAAGRHVSNGISTEWFEDGRLKRLVDYVDGVQHGIELKWDPSGVLISRTEYRYGTRTMASGGNAAGHGTEDM